MRLLFGIGFHMAYFVIGLQRLGKVLILKMNVVRRAV